MFDADPDHLQRRVSDWAQGFTDKAAKVQVMRAHVEQIQACASSPDGAVRITVDSHGVLTDLSFTDRIRDIRPPELATQVLTCLRRAQQQLAGKVQQAMQIAVGDEPQLVDNVVSSYRNRFGQDISQLNCTPADPGVLGLGALEDDSPPPRTVAPSRPRPRAADQHADDEYFADRGYLS
jgi:DNA-binding protein YbaB